MDSKKLNNYINFKMHIFNFKNKFIQIINFNYYIYILFFFL
jgi:hypothetical protein